MPAPTRRHFLAAAAAGLAARAAAGDDPPAPADRPPDPGVNAFGAALYRELARAPGNVVVSPVGVAAALAMTAAGAQGGTRDELAKALHLPADPAAAFRHLLGRLAAGPADQTAGRLSAAAAVWGQQGYPWRPEYRHVLERDYGAGLREADFGADPEAGRAAVNAWARAQTRGQVAELLAKGTVTPLTRVVLAAAVHFKGEWETKFDPAHTKDGPFTRADGSTVTVPLMTRVGAVRYAGRELTEARAGVRTQMVEVPYRGRDVVLQVVLPPAGGLPDLEEDVADGKLGEWRKLLQPDTVRLTLPKFRAAAGADLCPPLKALGVAAAFDDRAADLSGMHSGPDKLAVGLVAHRAVVDLSEEGTEAAAAAGVVVGARSAAGPAEFAADRPFLFLIRHLPTDAVLFVGRVENPKGGG